MEKARGSWDHQIAAMPMIWMSKKSGVVALSSTEAEYMALTAAAREEARIEVDNQSTIALAKNPEFHARTKHIDVLYHVFRYDGRRIDEGIEPSSPGEEAGGQDRKSVV